MSTHVYPEEMQKYWLQTINGVQFRPYDVDPSMILLDDIVHALSKICRYNGHTDQFYSVAQHSVYTSYLVPPQHAMSALMHDATEAYIGDMPKPIKMGQYPFEEMEQYIWEYGIAPRFGLPKQLPKEVKYADVQMLVYEKAHLMRDYGYDWGLDGIEYPDLGRVVPNFGKLPDGSFRVGPEGMPLVKPQEAAELFIQRYTEVKLLYKTSPL